MNESSKEGSSTTALATIARADLGKAADFAAKALPRYAVVPVLAGMRVTVDSGRITFAVFDYETAVRSSAAAETEGTASVLVTGPELVAAVKALPKGARVTADLMVDGSGVVIECAGVSMTVPGMDAKTAAEYPQLPDMPPERGTVDAEAFRRSVLRVAACAGTDDTLPVLTGVHAMYAPGTVTLTATDRYRLAVDPVPWTASGEFAGTALIPARALVTFAKAADKAGKVRMFADAEPGADSIRRAGFADGMREMIIMQISGEFPKIAKGIIREAGTDPTEVTTDAATLAAATVRAGKVLERGERLNFDVTAGGITLTAANNGVTVSTQHIPADVTGDDMQTGFNPAYLASVLAGVTGPARISLASPLKPAMVRGDDGFTAAVMPIRRPE